MSKFLLIVVYMEIPLSPDQIKTEKFNLFDHAVEHAVSHVTQGAFEVSDTEEDELIIFARNLREFGHATIADIYCEIREDL
jgi:hypothetical protein